MTVKRIGRRMFLAGAGGAALAIPFLPSLLSRNSALAQEPSPPRRFVAMHTPHGGVWGPYMWPADAMASTQHTVLPSRGHTFHSGPLAATTQMGNAVLSDVIQGPASVMTDALIAKMNLLRGLDVPWYASHGRHALGNYGSFVLAEPVGLPNQATVDQYIATSPTFYEATPRRRSIHVGENISTSWVNPETRDGGFMLVPSDQSSLGLFNEIYVPPASPGGPGPRPPLVDHVLESYRRLESGAHGPGTRLGAEDRQRLQSYMDRIRSVEASLNAGVAAACSEVIAPTANANGLGHTYTQYANEPHWYGPNFYQLYNDVLVAAFMCDSSRVATLVSAEDWHGGFNQEPYNGYHQGVAHPAAYREDRAVLLNVSNRNFFQYVFLDLISKLDSVVEANGSTLLDNSLVWWTHESGPSTHLNDSQPVITAGSAGGNLNTGLYVDYRDRDASFLGDVSEGGPGRRPGLHYYQWFTTILDAMGIPRAEWQVGNDPFSPSASVPSWFGPAHPYVDDILSLCDTPLPIISNI